MLVCHPGIGGMERFTRFLADSLLARGWRLTVGLSGENVYDSLASKWPGRLRVERLDWLDRNFAGDREYRWQRIAQRRAWFRARRPDVALFVQSSNTPFRASLVAAALAGVPIVTTHRTMAWPVENVPVGWYLGGWVRGLGLHRKKLIFKTWLTSALARCVVFNNHAVQGGYESLYGYSRPKSVVIPNAVQSHDDVVSSQGSSQVTVGFVGRLAPEKRLDLLLAALARVPALRLTLWGEGPCQADLMARACELGVRERVDFSGYTDDVWSAYRACDIVALCSPRESSSNMILEAMAIGKAVVVPRTGGMAELVDEGRAGLIVPPLDVDALTTSLQLLVDEPGLRCSLGSQARALAKARHDPAVIAQAWSDVLLRSAGIASLVRAGVRDDSLAGSPAMVR